MPGADMLASVFNGANGAYLADLYARWAADPGAVDPSFGELFGAMDDEARFVLEDASGASWAPRRFEVGEAEVKSAKVEKGAVSTEQVRGAALDSLRALMLIRAYRVRGHLEAKLDPLGLQVPKHHDELDPASYGFTEADLDRPIFIDNVLGRETATIREIVAIVRASYCGAIGVEFMHIQDPGQKAWIPAPDRRRELGAGAGRRVAAAGAAAADRGGGVRGVLPAAVCRHEALRARGWRRDHPGAARDHRDGGAGGRGRDRDRHAASRAAEYAGQYRKEAVHGAVQRVRRRVVQAG